MKNILLGIAAAALTPATMPAIINAPAVTQNITTVTNATNQETKISGLEITTDNAWLMNNSGDFHDVIKSENIKGGVGDCFNYPLVENSDTILMSTTYKSTRERFVKQKFAFNIEVPANTQNAVYDLNIPMEITVDMNGFVFASSFNGCIELFNQGTDWNARPEHYVDYTRPKPATPDKLSVDSYSARKTVGWGAKKFTDNTTLYTSYTLSNPTNKPVTKTCYFTISMYIEGENAKHNGNTGFGLKAKPSVQFNPIQSFGRNGMLGHHEYNYHSGDIVPFNKDTFHGGSGAMFDNPICERNKDRSYHINFNTVDLRQSERIIHQGFTTELYVPAHTTIDVSVKLNGTITSYMQSGFHREGSIVDGTLQLFNLGDSCHNQPESFTNHNRKSYRDKYEADEKHVYYETSNIFITEKVWNNQSLTTNFVIQNNSDNWMKAYRYFSISMFLGGYAEEINNFSLQYDANLSFDVKYK